MLLFSGILGIRLVRRSVLIILRLKEIEGILPGSVWRLIFPNLCSQNTG
ncbi:hypothetical protein LINPERHAP2_LOCUS3977 [Linum perenne]